MPRSPRVDEAGAIYHALNRGNARTANSVLGTFVCGDTAKRMLHTLSLSVQRHEQAFGALETDVQKRVVPQKQAPA